MYGQACGSSRGDWGDGEVRLVEIPTQAETNDNIVAFWVSRWPAKKGERKEYAYRLYALSDEAALSPAGRTVATRVGAVPNQPKQRRMVVEFAGGELASLRAGTTRQIRRCADERQGSTNLCRSPALETRMAAFIDFEPDGKKPVDLRAVLQLHGQTLTETWTGVFRP